MDSNKKLRHLYLVDIIRGVHEKLRRRCQEPDKSPEDVWKNHCAEKEMRQTYAQAMHELATTVWTDAQNSRINWCCSTWRWYFKESGIHKWIEKGKRQHPDMNFDLDLVRDLTKIEKLKVLDVGSCYNPFRSFEDCECLALDLTPASESVHECDFLSLSILEEQSDLNILDKGQVTHLPASYFHVVVFSLFLEYLPTPEQRWRCCSLASRLLTPLGLLLIVTPDSKTQHKNAPMIRSWKEALQGIGLQRVVYQKLPHLHCMAFRKVSSEPLSTTLELDFTKKMFIPQDTNEYKVFSSEICIERTELLDIEMRDQFSLLPFCDG